MNKEDLIKKWLDHSLTSQELEAFKKLEDYEELTKLSTHLQDFHPPAYATEEELELVLGKIKSKKSISWFRPLLKVAAVLVIGLSIYFYTSSLDTTVNTLAANKTMVELPDFSTVDLNAGSTLVFNKKEWKDHREVSLHGEAFFKVAKGSKFDVVTKNGTVTVLGTQFNVTQRDSYFEVICYEGLVGVSYKDYETKLKPGNSFLMIDGELIATEKVNEQRPSWLNNMSTFKSIPLKMVLEELERQYNVIVDASSVDTSKLFTGGFTHSDLEVALKSIILPFNLTYSVNDRSIILKRG